MRVSKPYLTFFISLILAIISSTIAYLSNWLIIIPVLYALGIPLLNIEKSLKQKIGLTLVAIIVSIVIFYMTVLTLMFSNFDIYIFPGILVGLAGIAILGINGLLIDSIALNFKTITLTFLLSGISFPIWIYLTENIFPKTNDEMVRQYGVMLFWMTLTTIGICFAIKKETKNETNLKT